MKIASVAIAIVLLALLASANIPSGPTTSIPEPTTKCSEYIATPSSDRIDMWIATMQQGLMNNPDLEQSVWICVMDIYKMSETDQFMLRACKADVHTPFEDLAFKAVAGHLAKCEVEIRR